MFDEYSRAAMPAASANGAAREATRYAEDV